MRFKQIMQKLKYFFTYSIFSLFAFAGQAQANDIVINKNSLFYPTFSMNEVLSQEDSQELPFGINIEEGRYFLTWESKRTQFHVNRRICSRFY